MLSRRCAKVGVKELAVPLGDGWMQRAGRGSFGVSGADGEGKGGEGKGAVMDIESLEPNVYLLTYDQMPDAQATKSGHYRVEATMRCLAGHPSRETPWAAVVLNWVRGRSTISAPCFTAVVLGANAWRLEQYADGQRTLIAEVRDASLKPGGAFHKLQLEVRDDRLSLHVNKQPIFSSLSVPPVASAGANPSRVAKLTGSAGLAVFKSRAQLKRFELSALDDAEGGPARTPFTGGDPKLVELIEGEMLEGCPTVEWESIGGCDEAKRLLNEAVILPILIPDYFAAAACRSAWKGVLLFGPPGTGKTLLARAVASLGKTAFFNISASSLVSKFHGESEKIARTLFALARHHAPSVVFFDEVDALASTRGAAGEHEASRRLKSELLSQMDGVPSSGATASEMVVVLATSNKPWDLDEAMRRRLERRIYVPLPDEPARLAMLMIHLKGLQLADDVDLPALAARTAGYSGADLQLVCRDASMMPMRRMVEGKSPAEIVELQAAGALDSAVSSDDFERATAQTQPTTAAHEHRVYEAWNREFGTDDGSRNKPAADAPLSLTLKGGAEVSADATGVGATTEAAAAVGTPADAHGGTDAEHKVVVVEELSALAKRLLDD